MLNIEQENIIKYIRNNPSSSSRQVFEGISFAASFSSFKRVLSGLIQKNYLEKLGKGLSSKYIISSSYQLIEPLDIKEYYDKEIDEREIRQNFNFKLIDDILAEAKLFTKKEINLLNHLQKKFLSNISELSKDQYDKELERLAIDLSWKSSQIEGNTYSLLETERLLKEKETAEGKTIDEAVMLLNHKDAIDFIVKNKSYLSPLRTSKIEDIHKVLTDGLNIEKNLRKRRIGISGTNYTPLDNQFQIMEALDAACRLINAKENILEKALLALLLISYIQPFTDGNKRTARIVCNAILITHNYCPLSFRTVNSIDYKKAMLLFYEQNNLFHFKDIFIKQYEFAVNTYF